MNTFVFSCFIWRKLSKWRWKQVKIGLRITAGRHIASIWLFFHRERGPLLTYYLNKITRTLIRSAWTTNWKCWLHICKRLSCSILFYKWFWSSLKPVNLLYKSALKHILRKYLSSIHLNNFVWLWISDQSSGCNISFSIDQSSSFLDRSVHFYCLNELEMTQAKGCKTSESILADGTCKNVAIFQFTCRH